MIALCPNLIAEMTTIEVIAVEYPPLSGQNLPSQGLSFEALNKQLRNSNIEIQPVFMPPARADYHLQRKNWHASVYWHKGVQLLPSFVHFSLDDNSIELGLFRKKQNDEFEWSNFSDLQGLRIGIPASHEQSLLQQKLETNGALIAPLETIDQGMQQLLANRLDMLAIVNTSAWWAIEQMELNPNDFQFSDNFLITYDSAIIWINEDSKDGQLLINALEENGLQAGPVMHVHEIN